MATAQRKTNPSVLNNPTSTLLRKQARTSTLFFTCNERKGVKGCIKKAPQHVNARLRHMHREHSASSDPTCALCTPFVWHTSDSLFYLFFRTALVATPNSLFCLCGARKVRTNTSNERSGNNPSSLTKQTTRTQCKCVV